MSTHESRFTNNVANSSSGALFSNEFGIVNISGTDFSSNVYSEALIKSKIWIILNEKLLLESSYCSTRILVILLLIVCRKTIIISYYIIQNKSLI